MPIEPASFPAQPPGGTGLTNPLTSNLDMDGFSIINNEDYNGENILVSGFKRPRTADEFAPNTGGFRLLEADTAYSWGGQIDLAGIPFKIPDAGGVVFLPEVGTNASFLYNGSAPFMSCDDLQKRCMFRWFTVNFTFAGSVDVFDIQSSSISSTLIEWIWLFTEITHGASTTLNGGTINGIDFITLDNYLITVNGTALDLTMRDFGTIFVTDSPTVMDGTNQLYLNIILRDNISVTINNCVNVGLNTGNSWINFDTTTHTATNFAVVLQGNGTNNIVNLVILDPTSNITSTSIGARFINNRGVENSTVRAVIVAQNIGAAGTSFAGLNTPTPFNLTFGTGIQEILKKASFTTSGRITNLSSERIGAQINFTSNLKTSAGNNKIFNLLPVIGNDTNNIITIFADAGPGVIVTSANHGLSNGFRVGILGSQYTGWDEGAVISSVTTDTFEITDTWINDDSGPAVTWVLVLGGAEVHLDVADPLLISAPLIVELDSQGWIQMYTEATDDDTVDLVPIDNVVGLGILS